MRHDVTRLSDDDLYLFNEGTHARIEEKLGAHPMEHGGLRGTSFAVWAPSATYVSVIGDFNLWDRGGAPLRARGSSGIWEGFVIGVGPGDLYKLHVASDAGGSDRADPFARAAEEPPRTASIVAHGHHDWRDDAWMSKREATAGLDQPMSVYEVHLGSWRRVPEDGNRMLSYRELAPALVEYVTAMGFTHVELLPVMEHPFYGSWGYQTTGYFAPTARHGSPSDFKALVDALHQAGIGVLLDWVPSHFPTDAHALAEFDGTHLFEHADPKQGFHPDWKSAIFNYERHEVRSFLQSSARYWCEAFHADGLRVDAVASMLYLDYSREDGQWIPNRHGGRENLGAIDVLRQINETVYTACPGVQTIAEESTSWPMVSRPTYVGGLGFGYKWDMGWMHDTLDYFSRDPLFRRHHQHALTFRMLYAFGENFVLPLSHDEVVHGKGSILGRMPGDRWQKFANLRALYGYMYGQPGKKLLFMGCEFGQEREWNHDTSLDWHLLDDPAHEGVRRWVADLNRLHREHGALHQRDCDPGGFAWVDFSDADASVYAFLRFGHDGPPVLVVCNFTPVPRHGYGIGVPQGGWWRELANSDAHEYGGSGAGNGGRVCAHDEGAHGQPHRVDLTLPPLSVLFLTPEESA
ncbi:MAG: 1,4-alpha-glucan branching protein GlgB [Myxococcota bacterium]